MRLLLLLSLLPQVAFGYAQFIAHGYTSCSSCHYNPYGNGPLTDYGRALWGAHLAAKPFFLPQASDEELAKDSGLLGASPLPEWFRGAVRYRGLLLFTNLNRQSSVRYINMQAEVSLIVRSDKESRFFAVGTFGYYDDPGTAKRISREHYLGFRATKEWEFFAGFMDIAFGIRIPDHVAYSRSRTNLAQNDQTHGVLIHLNRSPWEAGIHLFAGNLYQAGEVRPKGVSLIVERELGEQSVVGSSLLYSRNDFRERILGALHWRARVGMGHGLLAELGFISERLLQVGGVSTGVYLFSQYSHTLTRGLIFLPTLEFFTPRLSGAAHKYVRLGPGIQWFPAQRLELRGDLSGVLQFLDRTNSFNLHGYLQIHLSL